jgi:excisionase family DNA binding protein
VQEPFLTVQEIADLLKVNQQTVRNWIDTGRLPAVRIGRRIRVRRVDLDRLLAEGTTVALEPEPSTVAPAEALEELAQALERSRRLLGRRSATRRAELAEGLRELSQAVETALGVLSATRARRRPTPPARRIRNWTEIRPPQRDRRNGRVG